MVKVVHISTYTGGGAGRAALRLHEGLLNRQDIQSTFITPFNATNTQIPNHISIHAKKPNILSKVSNRLGIPILNSQKNERYVKNLQGDFEVFSMPTSDYTFETLDVIQDADVINLHWVSNFVNLPSFFKFHNKKAIVWTLHDMNPFMGGFHYRNDFLKNEKFHPLENHLSNIKRKAAAKAHNLHIVTPSKWLSEEAQMSNHFNHITNFEVIPYSLNLNTFRPVNKNDAKAKLNINPNIPCILIIAEYLDSYRKGFDLLTDALKDIKEHFQLLTIGNNKLNIKGNFSLIELGNIDNDEMMSMAYSAGDLFIIPSREDNLPNVMLESFSCGTPVLSFKLGGMKDWIIPGSNGIFTVSNDAVGLKESIKGFLISKPDFSQEKIREFAVKNFSLDIQASRYNDLYKSITR